MGQIRQGIERIVCSACEQVRLMMPGQSSADLTLLTSSRFSLPDDVFGPGESKPQKKMKSTSKKRGAEEVGHGMKALTCKGSLEKHNFRGQYHG